MARGKKKAADLSPEEKLKQALVPVEEQPYEVPENWCWVYWGNAGSFVAGSGFKNEYQGYTDYDIPFYKVGSLKHSDIQGYLFDESNTVNDDIRKKLKASLIPANSILFAKIGEAIRLNRRSLNPVPCCIDNNLMAFIPLLCGYKYAFQWSKGIELYDYTNATTVPAIRKSDLEKIPFPLAPLPEQKRIVDRIESIFAKLDEAKEKAQEVIDGFELRKSAILHQAFTGELTAKWRAEHGVGLDSWEKTTLNSVSERIFDGPFGSNLKSDDYTNSGIRVVRLENLKNLWFDDSKQSFVSTEKYETICKHTVYPSDIIMSTFIADEVKVCQMPDYIEYAVNKADCIGIRLTESACKKYILFFLSSKDTYKALLKNIHGATRPRVNTKQIKNIQIPLAPLPEQTEIVRILDTLLTREAAAKAAAEAVLDQIDTMKKAVLARAFRGELETNDPAEESAVELLKTVLG